jgi:UDP-sugar transporter A1/2/3
LLNKGFLVGYNREVVGVIILQAAGGLVSSYCLDLTSTHGLDVNPPVFQIVAVVVKYADNVLKGFATSLSIILSCIVSDYFFHDLKVSTAFLVGSAIVLSAVFLFGYTPTAPITSTKQFTT